MCHVEKKRGKSKSKNKFQFGFKIPKNWKDIIRIYTAVGNKNNKPLLKKRNSIPYLSWMFLFYI